MSTPTFDYIRANFARSFYADAPGTGFKGMDLPFPYTSPCIAGEGKFSFFFYWDTYFTNLGLLRLGHPEMARNNIRNMLWFIDRQGYMPNHTAIFNRSQPPYLCRMVEDYVTATGDEAMLAEAAPRLRQEYHFWTLARHTPTGLQRHGHHASREELVPFYGHLVRRLNLSLDVPNAEKEHVSAQCLAEAETGWDFNPRFSRRCLDHNPADLNGLLHSYEAFLRAHAATLGWDDAALWRERAERRRALVNELLWNEDAGWFFDYDFVNGRQSSVPSLGGLLPLFTGLASAEQAKRVAAKLPDFERDHGVAVTPDLPVCVGYQWAFPNVWPPLVYVTVAGLRRYGLHADADRIARKFLATTDALFAKTGRIWEKTDAVTGEVAGGEYEAAAMMGWTAGVYVELLETTPAHS